MLRRIFDDKFRNFGFKTEYKDKRQIINSGFPQNFFESQLLKFDEKIEKFSQKSEKKEIFQLCMIFLG